MQQKHKVSTMTRENQIDKQEQNNKSRPDNKETHTKARTTTKTNTKWFKEKAPATTNTT